MIAQKHVPEKLFVNLSGNNFQWGISNRVGFYACPLYSLNISFFENKRVDPEMFFSV